jgi:hypothetical protein
VREVPPDFANSRLFHTDTTCSDNALPAASESTSRIDGNKSTGTNESPGKLQLADGATKRKRAAGSKKLPEPLQEFLDNCIIPALVEKYLAQPKERR